MSESMVFSAGSLKRQSLMLLLLRLPAFVPLILIARGWLALNAKDVLTNTEADVLGTGGEICFFAAVSITPIITLTGWRWIAPLRRWYGIMFAVIGIADSTTAALTTDFAGGVFGRLAGHTFLLSGFLFIVLHLLLLDGFRPFGADQGDGDPVFHQRFYQAVAISLPLLALRIPPVRR